MNRIGHYPTRTTSMVQHRPATEFFRASGDYRLKEMSRLEPVGRFHQSRATWTGGRGKKAVQATIISVHELPEAMQILHGIDEDQTILSFAVAKGPLLLGTLKNGKSGHHYLLDAHQKVLWQSKS